MAERARPTFIIGGAPRAGTNFLCHALDRHPDVYMAKPYMPEPKVFMGPEQPWPEYARRYAALFAAAGDRAALGEKTSYYLEHEAACALIARHLPDVRMLFIVREPVARAYSNYLWTRKNGLETLVFEEAVRLEGQRPSPLPPDREYARPYDYVPRGRYDLFAARWFDALGRDRVRFVLYEDVVARPEPLLAGIQDFIGVRRVTLGADDLGVINSAREMGPPLEAATEKTLRERMAPSVRRFAALTGLDVSPWGYPA
ncbi:MAG TPA: sulfotransferase [Methylomirabilota bacterium]|nr:sulfotransferase [Methylomirabilota bacterium]